MERKLAHEHRYSQNATDNPKLERGTIFTDAAVFNFDLNVLENEYYYTA